MQRLSARARLDESPAALSHATARAESGDESWEQWLAEYRRGDALILRLELTLELAGDGNEVLRTSTDGLFVENHVHAPKVEQQIAELASGDFAALAGQVVRRGRDLDVHGISAMYVHVELDPDVQHRVRDRRAVPPVGPGVTRLGSEPALLRQRRQRRRRFAKQQPAVAGAVNDPPVIL